MLPSLPAPHIPESPANRSLLALHASTSRAWLSRTLAVCSDDVFERLHKRRIVPPAHLHATNSRPRHRLPIAHVCLHPDDLYGVVDCSVRHLRQEEYHQVVVFADPDTGHYVVILVDVRSSGHHNPELRPCPPANIHTMSSQCMEPHAPQT